MVAYYAETLATHDEARSFLARRKIDHPEAAERFRLGFGDRTLGYRLPHSQLREGKRIRSRLQALGILRATGHEHFRGSLVIPVADEAGDVGEVYGRKIRDDLRAGTPKHLYLPGPHRGVFNAAAFAETDELIVCESLLDALTLWCAGFRHVTATYGTDGWTSDHQQAIERHGIGRVLIAFDADEAGDRGAAALAEQLAESGVETFRVQLPCGTDLNQIAVQAGDPAEVLGRFLRKATWLDTQRPAASQPSAAVVPLGCRALTIDMDPVSRRIREDAVSALTRLGGPDTPVLAFDDEGATRVQLERESCFVEIELDWREGACFGFVGPAVGGRVPEGYYLSSCGRTIRQHLALALLRSGFKENADHLREVTRESGAGAMRTQIAAIEASLRQVWDVLPELVSVPNTANKTDDT